MHRDLETLEQRVQRAVKEDVAIAAYDPLWPELFRQERASFILGLVTSE
jgi:hypothetical protein